jgi:hypothetical protein
METMATVMESPKAGKTFYATLYDESGLMGKVKSVIYFLRYSDGEVIEFEPTMSPWVCILGEAGIADSQQIADRVAGGYAALACSRDEGRS